MQIDVKAASVYKPKSLLTVILECIALIEQLLLLQTFLYFCKYITITFGS